MAKQIAEARETLRVLRFPELHKKVGLCRSQIWRMEQQGDFPKSIKLGANSRGWIEADVDAWLQSKMAVA